MRWPQNRRVIGTKVQRLDGPDKATGRAKYSFDINREGMLHGRILRCPYAHARVRSIDMKAAEKMPGVRAVHVIAPAKTELYYAGAEVGDVAADTEEHAEDAIRAIRVQYDQLPHLVKEEDALRIPMRTMEPDEAGGATTNVTGGGESTTDNFDQEAYRDTAGRAEGRYGAAVVSHHCLESHGLVAEWDKDQRSLTVWASTQAVPLVAQQLANHFKLAVSEV